MSRGTSYAELYTTIRLIIEAATRREGWKKAAIQTAPNSPYFTLFLEHGEGVQNEVVENLDSFVVEDSSYLGQPFKQVPWGTSRIKVKIDFIKSVPGDDVISAATRCKQALRMEQRFVDLWGICSLAGSITLIDMSAIFRADIEPRSQIVFDIYANIVDPAPFDDSDLIWDIDTQTVRIIHVKQDNEETEITINVENTQEES